MSDIGNYTAIYGNMIYTVNEVEYKAFNERRLFYKNVTYFKINSSV